MRMWKRFLGITLIASLLGAVSAQAITCGELNDLWQRKYFAALHADWKREPFACPTVASSIAEGIYELDHTSFVGKNAPDFYKWVTSIITRTTYQQYHPVTRTFAASSYGGLMTIYEPFAAQSLEYRTGTFVHETRHSQSDDPQHVKCTHGDVVDGSLSCDAEFFHGNYAGSGYNYELVYYWWVRDGSNVTDLNRQMADALIRHLILDRFNKITAADVKKFAP